MTWIKRNLFFVITLAAGLALTGYCGYLFFNGWGANEAAKDEFQQNATELSSLQKAAVEPTEENMAKVAEDQKTAAAFMADFHKVFASFPPVKPTDDRGFKALLDETIMGLRAAATNNGVGLLDGYAFGFSDQQASLVYPPENILAWEQQLLEIKAICNILFDAKINSLEDIRRVHVTDNDRGAPGDYLEAPVLTNASKTQVLTPYVINFRGFSRDLAAVIEALARSSNCIVIKDIDVTPSAALADTPQAQAAAAPPAGNPGPGLMPRGTEGADPRRRGNNGPPSVSAPSPAGPPVKILSEHLLRVTMALDLVKFREGGR